MRLSAKTTGYTAERCNQRTFATFAHLRFKICLLRDDAPTTPAHRHKKHQSEKVAA